MRNYSCNEPIVLLGTNAMTFRPFEEDLSLVITGTVEFETWCA